MQSGTLRVCVVRGGTGAEYEASLQSGGVMLAHLPDAVEKHDVLIARDGVWHFDGVPVLPHQLARACDVAVNALHGGAVEDGTVQRLFENIKLPYTGSTPFPSALGAHRTMRKERVRQLGVKTPRAEEVSQEMGDPEEVARRAFARISSPWAVKPVRGSFSFGVSVARDFPSLVSAIREGFAHARNVLVEEMVRGREVTVGVIDRFRGQEHYALLPEGSPLRRDESLRAQEVARVVHEGLGLRHYSQTSCVVSPRGIFVIEVNTFPLFHYGAPLPNALDAIGCSYSDFLGHLVQLAREGAGR